MYTIGADVELFGVDKTGKFIALCDKIGGTKENPRQLDGAASGFMVQEDNVSLEYNIPPAADASQFVENISFMRGRTKEILTKLGLEQSTVSAVSFTSDQLVHPKARVFGCEPDFDAWKKEENERPVLEDANLRTAGGHVHVGTDSVDMIDGIRAMDLFLGVPSVILDSSPESVKRRLSYGKAGAMRPKPYGFEYRVLSNFWMFDDALTRWVFEATHLSLQFCQYKGQIDNIMAEAVQKCINTGDVASAKVLIAEHGLYMPGDDYRAALSRTNWGRVPRQSAPKLDDLNFDAFVQHLYAGNLHHPIVVNAAPNPIFWEDEEPDEA